MKTQNTKTKIVTVMASLVIGLMLISTTTEFPNVSATTHSHVHPLPQLSSSENQAIINTALSAPGLQSWSHGWKYVTMGFGSNNKLDPDFQWQYALVTLKAPSSSAPVSCDIDWWAYVEIDMTTMKVISTKYPTMESHICHGDELGIKPKHTWSIAEQDDLNSSSYYGIYADLNAPDYLSSVFTALNSSYVAHVVNSFFPDGGSTGCHTNVNGGCLEQAGWVIGSNGGNHANIVYVDFSKIGTFVAQPTTITWKNGYTTNIQGEIDCSPGPANYTITLQNGTGTFAHTTNISCSTAQDSSDIINNSVFFESADGDTTQNWSNDITGTVGASSALEFTGTSSSQSWVTSNNRDLSCTGTLSISQVISGSLDSGGTATWSSLNKQPHACY